MCAISSCGPTSRDYLAGSGRFAERWRGGLWSHFELTAADDRTVVTQTGAGELEHLDLLGADVALTGVVAGDPVVVRANFYPAWRATLGDTSVPLYASGGQLAFRAPRSGDYVVRLDYPKYASLSVLALLFARSRHGLPDVERLRPPTAAAQTQLAGA